MAISKRVRARPEDRREQILAEATRLIGEKGYYGFGIRELAQRCQISNPGLLHHFPSKEELLIALLKNRDRRTTEAALDAVSRLPPRERGEFSLTQLYKGFEGSAVRNCADPELMRLFAVLRAESLNEQHPAHGFFVERQALIVREYTASLVPFVDDPASVALHLVVTFNGLQEEWLRSNRSFDFVAEVMRAASRLIPAPRDLSAS